MNNVSETEVELSLRINHDEWKDLKMNRNYTNATIFTMAQVLFGQESFLKNNKIKTRVAIRQALKFNCVEIESKYKLISEMLTEIINETQADFIEENKAILNDGKFEFTDKSYETEYISSVNAKLHEFEMQTVDLNIKTYSQREYDLYVERNDGEFTDQELDILEMFIESNKDNEEDENE